jgi:hypothetical protein
MWLGKSEGRIIVGSPWHRWTDGTDIHIEGILSEEVCSTHLVFVQEEWFEWLDAGYILINIQFL